MEFQVALNSDVYSVQRSGSVLKVDNKSIKFDIDNVSENRMVVFYDNRAHEVEVLSRNEKRFVLMVNGKTVEVEIKDEIDQLLQKLGMTSHNSKSVSELKSPMPGAIIDVMIEAGDEVSKGDPILILEAMKMEHSLKASRDGVVAEVLIEPGQQVAAGDALIRLDEEAG